MNDGDKFPYADSDQRLRDYKHYDQLFEGKHFDAFAQKINSVLYQEQYARLKYVTVNFAGLLSKVSADMLFGENIRIRTESPELEKWLADLMFENKMDTQLYESALINSRLGDDVFKVRGGKRNPSDTVGSVIIEQINPDIYFPKYQAGNWRANPEYQDLAFKVKVNNEDHVRIERHYVGYYENLLYRLKDGVISGGKVPITQYDPTMSDRVETGIDRSLVIHTPNWRAGKYWGISDYADLESLMYALNNRVTKNENVLDKHTDPILSLPEGVLNEKGEVDRKALEIYTVPANEVGGTTQKPEYITWNASLDNSFKQIDKLMEFLFITSETSPGVFGMDKNGQAESGRALKLKLMRTIAKINRKKRFYDQSIKEALYVAQLLAQKQGYLILGNKIPTTPAVPNIEWQDGLPIDDYEVVDLETKKIEGGIQSKKDAIAKIDQISDVEAQKKLEEITEEKSVAVPAALGNNFIDGNKPNGSDNADNNGDNEEA